MTEVVILMTTWLPESNDGERRLNILSHALQSWKEHLKNSGEIFLHVADDGSSPEMLHRLREKVELIWKPRPISWSGQTRRGVGTSLNSGILFYWNKVILHAVDDWQLYSDLDLTPWVSILEEEASICAFRFFPHPDLTGEIKYITPGVYAMNLDKHHFAFATRPSLWHPRMFEAYGLFEEKTSAYEVERLYNEEYCRLVGPKIWLALPDQWAHLGGVELGDITP